MFDALTCIGADEIDSTVYLESFGQFGVEFYEIKGLASAKLEGKLATRRAHIDSVDFCSKEHCELHSKKSESSDTSN